MMPTPGDVVLVPFMGAKGIKQRPAIVVSSDLYHSCRPDLILGLLTSQVAYATLSTDYLLQDWHADGLKVQSVFRCYFTMVHVTAVIAQLGVLSDRDWAEVQARLRLALAV